MKRTLSILLIAVMLIGVLAAAPVSASAATYVTKGGQKSYISYGQTITYRYPVIHLPGSEIASLNKKFKKTFTDYCADADKYASQNVDINKGLNYYSYVNGSILSLVIEKKAPWNNYIEYEVYNFNIKTGKRLTNANILSTAGVTANAAKKNVIALLKKEFSTAANVTSMKDIIKKHTDKSIADNNMKDNLYYLGKNGKLCAMYRIYWIAGSGCYYRLAALSAYAATPAIAGFKNIKSGIYMKWNKVAGAAKYRLYVKTSSGWKKVADTAKLNYTYTKVKVNQKYTFTLRALDKYGNTVSSYNKTGFAKIYRAV